MALSWPNLPCALKAAIGIGKQTLGHPGQSAAPQGPQQGLLRAKHARDDPRPIARRDADERLAQPRLGRRIRHERAAFGLCLSDAAGTHIGRIRRTRLAGAFCVLAKSGAEINQNLWTALRESTAV